MTATPPPKHRTIVYVDGFNLYYLALKGTPYKWLDLAALADRVLGARHGVVKVRYFTAHVLATPRDPSGPQRQQLYLEALSADPRIEIHLGQFRPRTKDGPIVRPRTLAGQFASISTFEEKGSDVNLAVWTMADSYENRADAVVLVTNDSDLAEPARLLRARGTVVGVAAPRPGLSSKRIPADFLKTIRPADLAACQLPATVRSATGSILRRPPRW